MKRIKPLSDTLENLRKSYPNFHILDLFPVLCPEERCEFFSRGVPLYRDVWSHPSIEADYLARSAFLSVVNEGVHAANALVTQTSRLQ